MIKTSIYWDISAHSVASNRVALLQQGHQVPSIFLILAGEAEIFVEINGVSKQVGSSRRGELLGELTLLTTEAQGATATVRSAGGMELLELNKTELNQVLQDNPSFGERFYRSLSCMLSERSRDQLLARQLASRSNEAERDNDEGDELDLVQLGGINRADSGSTASAKHSKAAKAVRNEHAAGQRVAWPFEASPRQKSDLLASMDGVALFRIPADL